MYVSPDIKHFPLEMNKKRTRTKKKLCFIVIVMEDKEKKQNDE